MRVHLCVCVFTVASYNNSLGNQMQIYSESHNCFLISLQRETACYTTNVLKAAASLQKFIKYKGYLSPLPPAPSRHLNFISHDVFILCVVLFGFFSFFLEGVQMIVQGVMEIQMFGKPPAPI